MSEKNTHPNQNLTKIDCKESKQIKQMIKKTLFKFDLDQLSTALYSQALQIIVISLCFHSSQARSRVCFAALTPLATHNLSIYLSISNSEPTSVSTTILLRRQFAIHLSIQPAILYSQPESQSVRQSAVYIWIFIVMSLIVVGTVVTSLHG